MMMTTTYMTFMSLEMLQISPKCTPFLKNFPGGDTPRPPIEANGCAVRAERQAAPGANQDHFQRIFSHPNYMSEFGSINTHFSKVDHNFPSWPI